MCDEETRAQLKARVESVLERIEKASERAGRNPSEITLIAVSKTFSAELIRCVAELGIKDFGENYVQEALPKISETQNLNLKWHFIGRLQTNKAKFIPGRFVSVHSVDSLKLVRELEKRCAKAGISSLDIFVQVNVGEEETKGGLPPDPEKIAEFLQEIWDTAKICRPVGLMCIPPPPEKPEDSRPFFRKLFWIKQKLEDKGFRLPYLSMGMTDDFEVAVEEGATHLRIGRAIFGERPPKTST